MGMFFNSKIPYEAYRKTMQDTYFVDKSLLLEELMPAFGKINCYCCITRPRRFGKTVMANMVGAFFGKTDKKDRLFDSLEIAKKDAYEFHLNRHDMIYLDFSKTPKNCKTYGQYIARIQDGIVEDLISAYPDCGISRDDAVWDAFQKVYEKTEDKFLFVMDEWDAVFHMPFISREEQQEYLLFLKNMLKDQPYVEFAYMTGVLPIAKYSSGSELNMFVEYDMVTSEKFSEYFGFSDVEVDCLYERYRDERNWDRKDKHKINKDGRIKSEINDEININKINNDAVNREKRNKDGSNKDEGIWDKTKVSRFSRQDLRIWYDGYYTATGIRLYNPRSVVLALTDNQLRNYWTSSGPYDELFYYIRNNIEEVREDLALMVSGERVAADIGQFTAASMEISSREQIYSAMVVYGLLTYEDGNVLIPNKELMDKFNELLLSRDSLGYVYRLAKKSEQMLQATLSGDTKIMAEILQFAHDTEAPILSYNSETELSAVINLCYLSARNKYRIEREDKAGKGFVDFIFYPERKCSDCIILELKVDSTPNEAIAQIKDKGYALRFKGKLGEKPKYTGRILAVGISYSKKTKVHRCKVEDLGSDED